MAKKILITGGSTYAGQALINDYLNHPHEYEVRTTCPIGSAIYKAGLQCFECERLENRPDLSEVLRDCDVVIHVTALAQDSLGYSHKLSSIERLYVMGAIYLARAAAYNGVKRFVFLSSISVDGEITPPGKKFYADSLPRPKLPTGKTLLTTERELQKVCEETGMELVIVRSPMIYGPGCHNFFRAVQIMVNFCLPLPLRNTNDNERSLVCIDNLISFLKCVSEHKKAANEIFLVSDGNDLSTYEIFKLLAKTGNRPCLLWPFPKKLLALFNSYIGRRAWGEFFFESQVEDISKNKLLLDWTPPVSVKEGFKRSWNKKLTFEID